MKETKIPVIINFSPLFEELKEECLKAVGLIEALKIKELTEDQKAEIEGSLGGSISTLKLRTELLEKELEESWIKEEEDAIKKMDNNENNIPGFLR